MKHRKIPAIALVGALLSGCALQPRFVQTAVHYNTVVEDTNNELLLLNVIRGKEGRPMYFTRISALRNNITAEGELGITTAIPGQDFTEQIAPGGITETISRGVNSFNPNASASYQIAPGFDYQILDSQPFQRGIQTPISATTFAHYLLQGWPDELIASILIEEITIEDKDGAHLRTIENDPENATQMKYWRYFLSCFNIESAERDATTLDLPGINISDISTDNLDGVILFNDRNWVENSNTGNWNGDPKFPLKGTLRLNRPRSTSISIKSSPGRPCNGNRLAQVLGGSADVVVENTELSRWAADSQSNEKSLLAIDGVTDDQKSFINLFEQSLTASVIDAPEPTAGSEDQIGISGQTLNTSNTTEGLRFRIVPRSLQGIMYYLGECTRVQATLSSECYYDRPIEEIGTFKEYVFHLEQGANRRSAPDDITMVTQLYGDTYWVRERLSLAPDMHSTWQTLSFANQLLNLQKEATDAPSTATIRTVD